jgi:hypothetical protein
MEKKTTKEIIQNEVCGVLGYFSFLCMLLGFFAAMDGVPTIFLVGLGLSLLTLLIAFFAETPTLVRKLFQPKIQEKESPRPRGPFWRTTRRHLIRRHSWQKWIKEL